MLFPLKNACLCVCSVDISEEGVVGVGGAWAPRIRDIPCVYTAPPVPPSKVLHAAMRVLDLVSVVRDLGTPPLNELTNNTVEGQNNRLKVMGLKGLPPLDWLLAMLAMEAEYWSRELHCARAWAQSMVRILQTKKGCNKGRSDGAVEGVWVVPMTYACTYPYVSTYTYIYLYICMYIFIHAYLCICAYLYDVVKRKER